MQPETLSGTWKWFKTVYPQKWQNVKDCEARIDEIWLAGKTDEKAKTEFNEQLRIYRNGHLWMLEKYLAWLKEKEAADKANAGKPAQARLL